MLLDFLFRLFKGEDKPLVRPPLKGKIWAIGGGKGGVGKSFIASSLACGLAQKGYSTILIDADLSGANIHTLFGIRVPEYTLDDFIKKKVKNIEGILLPTPIEKLKLICGASDMLELANPKYSQKKKLIKGFESLKSDYVIIDVGAGSSFNNLDFFNMADMGIIVTCPIPTAIQNAYGFMKMALHRKLLALFADKAEVRQKINELLEGDNKVTTLSELITQIEQTDQTAADIIQRSLDANRYRLIVNMATEAEGNKIAGAMASTSNRHLGIKLLHMGTLGRNAEVEASVRKMTPLMLMERSDTSENIKHLVDNIISDRGTLNLIDDAQKYHVTIKTSDAASVQTGLNEDITYIGKQLHVQTEDLGAEKGQIQTLVYAGGRIIFSKVSTYEEIKPGGNTKLTVAEKLQWQHTTIIGGVMAGRLKDKILRL